MAEKFRRYANGLLTTGRIEDVIKRVQRLEDESDIANLASDFRSR